MLWAGAGWSSEAVLGSGSFALRYFESENGSVRSTSACPGLSNPVRDLIQTGTGRNSYLGDVFLSERVGKCCSALSFLLSPCCCDHPSPFAGGLCYAVLGAGFPPCSEW